MIIINYIYVIEYTGGCTNRDVYLVGGPNGTVFHVEVCANNHQSIANNYHHCNRSEDGGVVCFEGDLSTLYLL